MSLEKLIQKNSEILAHRMPADAAPILSRWIVERKVRFTITKPRKSKLGDFRPPRANKLAQITVNGDLNPYNFLVTAIHEFAHLDCYLEHGNKVNPHGSEWKGHYKRLLKPFMEMHIFPQDILKALHHHLSNPSASSCGCPHLSRALAKYNLNETIFLGDLDPGTTFTLQNTIYTKLHKRRTRYVCRRFGDEKEYLISGLAPVELIAI